MKVAITRNHSAKPAEKLNINELASQALERSRARLHEEVRRQAKKATAQITVEVSADTYGIIAGASVAHNCTVSEALGLLLNHTDAACDWLNSSYRTD